MDELSLNILDIAQNSIAAEAAHVGIYVTENDGDDSLVIRIVDDGRGMSAEFLAVVQDPFITTRNTRKIGLGISFLKEAAEMTGGSIDLKSTPGVGTEITAFFSKSHIDRQPLGDLAGTIVALVTLNPEIDFHFCYTVNGDGFDFTTQEVREILGDGAELSSPSVIVFLTEYLDENISNISGGI